MSIKSTLERVPHVITDAKVIGSRGRVVNVKKLVKRFQAIEHNHVNTYYTQQFNSVPSGLFANNGAKYSANIEAGSFEKKKSITLKITLTVNTSSAVLAPVPYWFERIEYRSQDGNTGFLGIQYGDNLMFNLATLDDEKLKGVLKNANMGESWQEEYKIESTGTRTFYLPLVGSFLDGDMFWTNIKSDVVLDFYPASDIRVSGTGTVTVSEMSLVIDTDDLSDSDRAEHVRIHKQFITSNRYLEAIPVSFNSQTLSASTQTKLDLSNVVGDVAFLTMIIRATGASNTSNANFNYVPIGDYGTLDIIDPGGKSIWGSGTSIQGKYLRNQVWQTHFNSRLSELKAVYFLPFCQDALSAYSGKKDGYMRLDGSRYYLAVTPGSAGVAEVQTITLSNAGNDAGYYRLFFKGYMTDPLAYNETVGNIKTALEALPSFIDYNGRKLTVTASGTAQATFTLTFGESLNLNGDKVELIAESLSDAGVVDFGITTVTTVGKEGFTTGTYDISCYAYIHKSVDVRDGKLSVRDD